MATYTVINYSEAVLQTSDKKRIIPIAPAVNNFNNNILISNDAKRKGRVKDVIRGGQPAPIAVARRNARERNRVKQVNNGFAILRSHIPTTILQDGDNGKNKKLSKVDTLRLAVEYIRRLEDLLSFSGSENEENESISSFSSYPMVSSPNEQEFQIKTEIDQNSPQKHSYEFYEDDENIHADITNIDDDILSETHLIDSTVDISGRNISFINSIHSTGSLSPELTSEHSLSPKIIDRDNKTIFLEQMNTDNFSLKYSVLRNAQISDDANLIQISNWWPQEHLKS